MVATQDQQILKVQPKLIDREWRLNNLYHITDESGERVLFKFNEAQRVVYDNMHYNNIILKSRQHGITTLFCIMMLDYILWNANKEAAITTHRMPASRNIFRTKVLYPFYELPDFILNDPMFKPKRENETELLFPDARGRDRSSISAQVGLRSGTYHWVHISEYAKLCKEQPLKAKEIQTGAFETVHEGQILTIESTAEGPQGDFFDKCRSAEKQYRERTELGPLDWRFFFFPWHMKSSNRTDPKFVKRTAEDDMYFDKLEKKEQCALADDQRAWYVAKKKTQGRLMTQEHPSTSDEAFYSAVKGAFWADEIRDLERRFPPQITNVPFNRHELVHTIHDPGYHWAIWFVQEPMGVYPKFINFFEFIGMGTEYACEMLDQFKDTYGYRYGKHICPIDVDSNAHKQVTGITILTAAKRNGYNFSKMKRIPSAINLIEQARIQITNCFFDDEKCQEGMNALVSFRRRKDELLSTEDKPRYLDEYVHDWSSHAGSAFYHFFRARSHEMFLDQDAETVSIKHIREMNAKFTRPR